MSFEKAVYCESRKTQTASVVINAIIALSTLIIATSGVLFGAGSGQLGNFIIGLRYFEPYTMDSNIFAGVTSAVVAAYGIRNLKKGKDGLPGWLVEMHLMASSCLFMTILIVTTFLAPMKVMEGKSYFVFFSDDMFFFHFLNPLLSVFSFIFLTGGHKLDRRVVVKAAIPTLIYSVVYFVMVVVLKKWEDFYNFTFGGRYYLVPAVVVVCYALILSLASILVCSRNKRCKGN